jgi:hypothetical protein
VSRMQHQEGRPGRCSPGEEEEEEEAVRDMVVGDGTGEGTVAGMEADTDIIRRHHHRHRHRRRMGMAHILQTLTLATIDRIKQSPSIDRCNSMIAIMSLFPSALARFGEIWLAERSVASNVRLLLWGSASVHDWTEQNRAGGGRQI